MGDIAQRGNKLTKGVKDLVTGSFKGAKKVAQGARDLITAPSKRIKKFGGGRTNLLEELGRVEAEPSNRNRRAEISRVHGELNRGYAKGGRAGFEHGGQAETKALGGFRKVSKNQKKFKKGMSKPSWITKKEKPKSWITKKEKPKSWITKKEKKPLSMSIRQAVKDVVAEGGSPKLTTDEARMGRIDKKLGILPADDHYQSGGRTGFKKGTDKKWIQKAVNPKHKGYCTPMTKKTCTPARKALARTFKKKAKTGWS